MGTVATIDELEGALLAMEARGVRLSFGPSASPLRHGQWFATLHGDPDNRQCRAETLRDALNAMLGQIPEVDLITPAPKVAIKPASVKLPKVIDLSDLLT